MTRESGDNKGEAVNDNVIEMPKKVDWVAG
jgi:hypothetical protein